MLHQVFSFIDWVVLGAYIFIIFLIGLLAHRSADGVREFFFARGQLPWWAVGMSMIATSVSASTFLGNPAESFQHDLRLLQLNLGVPISALIVCIVFIPFFRTSQVQSAYEALETRFGLPTRMLASSMYIIHLLLRTGILIYGPAILFSTITGISLHWTIVAIGIATVTYCALGGIRAVIWTDALQFAILFGGGVLICWYIAQDVPGGTSAILSAAAEHGKLRWFDSTWNLADPRNVWSAGVAYIVLDLAIRSSDQQFIQRYLSCRSRQQAQYAAILSVVLGCVVAVLFFLLGTYLWGFYFFTPQELPSGISPNQVLPQYIATKLPWGMSGLIVAAVFAAAMSSLDSAINALSNTATFDFFERLGGKKAESFRFAKLSTVVWGTLGIVFGLYAANFGENLFVLALSFTSLFTGTLLGLFLLAVGCPWCTKNGAFFGAIGGTATLMIGIKLLHWPVSWPWYPAISSGSTVALAVCFSALEHLSSQKKIA